MICSQRHRTPIFPLRLGLLYSTPNVTPTPRPRQAAALTTSSMSCLVRLQSITRPAPPSAPSHYVPPRAPFSLAAARHGTARPDLSHAQKREDVNPIRAYVRA